AVLRDDACEEIHVREDGLQIVELAAGDEHELAARFAQALERRERGLVDAAMMNDGAVVIAAQREIAHAVKVLGVAGCPVTPCNFDRFPTSSSTPWSARA